MDFFTEVERIATLLAEHGRVSLAGITHDVGGDRDLAESVGSELVTRGVARWDGGVLVAVDDARAPSIDNTPDRGELRHVTVMFCDVVDSTRLSTHMDAEQWTTTIRAIHNVIAASVEEWGGHVGNYLGDGVIAYFGYPVAREDAAERGVRAGLGILDQLEEIRAATPADDPLAVRIGLHTGPVVVDEFGGVIQAMGETTNVAARIEGSAPPNGVVVSPDTKRLVAGVFVTDDLGERTLKGVAEPVAITQVLRVGGVAPRLGAGRTARTPLVGRQLELGLLDDRWNQARDGWGQAVVITGEAGIGKSRLVDAFRSAITDQAHSWLDAACSPYAQSSALAPMAELQRRGLGFSASDGEHDRATALHDALANVGLDGVRGAALLSELHGLGVVDPLVDSMSPEHRRNEVLSLLIDWVIELARLQPTVFFLDDTHWADPTTIELAGRLIDACATEQLFLIVTARPDRVPEWSARSNLTPMQLARMTREQVAELAQAVAGSSLSDDALDTLVRRSDGVPLFAEELAIAVAASPDGRPQVPSTLQDLLMARLEQLGPLREIAQTASVIGREFHHADIASLAPVGADELVRMLDLGVSEELFYRRGVGTSASYIFRHALMRDAIYDSMLTPTRARHHLRFARSLVETRPQDATELPEVVARHFDAGDEIATATVWWERAADQAIATAAADEAEGFYLRAIESCGDDDERRLDLHIRLAGAMNPSRGYGHPDLVGVWDEIIRLAVQLGDDAALACGLSGMGLAKAIAGDFATAREELDAEHAAAPDDAHEIELGIGAMESLILAFEGRPERCIELGEALQRLAPAPHALERFNQAVGVDVSATLGGYTRYSMASCGRFRSARRELRPDHSIQPATHANLLALSSGHETMMYDGRVRRSGDSYDQANRVLADFTRHHHLRFFELIGTLPIACADAILGNDSAKVATAWDCLAELGGSGSMIAAPMFLFDIARAELACGEPDKAVGTAEAGLALAADTAQHYVDPFLHAVRLEAQHALGVLPGGWLGEVAAIDDFARERSLASGRLSLALAAGRVGLERGETAGAADRLRVAVAGIPEPEEAPIVADAVRLLDMVDS